MDTSALAAGLKPSSVGRGQKRTRVYAGIQKEKEMQTAQNSGGEVQETEQSRRSGSQTPAIDGFLRIDYFRSWEIGLRGALTKALGMWVRARPCRKGPAALRGAGVGGTQQAPRPGGADGGLFHFKVKICRLWETIFKKVYNLHMPLNGGSS